MRLLALSPALFWGALAAATLAALALHFLRIRSPRVLVPTLLFWRQAMREQAPRVLFRRLARLLTLLLILCILWALLLAAAEPLIGELVHEVVLLDPAALETERAREEVAQSLEEEARSRRGVRRALVVAGRPCRVLGTFADPDTGLARLVKTARGEGGPAVWAEALSLAGRLLAGLSRPAVRVFLEDPESLPPDAEALCGVPLRQQLLVAPLWDDGVQAAGPVFGPSGTASVLIRAERRGRGGSVRRLVVNQGGVEREAPLLADDTGPALVRLKGLLPGTRITAQLTGQDSRPLNDGLEMQVPDPPRLRIFVADPEIGPVLEALLGALPGVELVESPLHGAVAVTRSLAGEERCQEIPALCFRGGANGGDAPPLSILSDHPLVSGLTFTGVRAAAAGLLPPGDGEPLLGAGSRVVARLDRANPTRIWVALDPEERASGLAESMDFPRFVARALAGLAGEPEPPEALQPGHWAPLGAGLGERVLDLAHESGVSLKLPLRRGRGEWLPARSGAYTLAGQPGFDVPGGGPARARPAGVAGQQGQAEAPGIAWTELLALAVLILLLFEWWALHRGRVA